MTMTANSGKVYLAVSPGMGTGEDPGRWAIVNLE